MTTAVANSQQYHQSYKSLQKRKKELKSELIQIEKQIYDLETTYLEETKEFGNVFTGWDSYLSSEKMKVKKSIHYEDRHFSLSSVTSPASRREEKKLKPESTKKRKKAKTENNESATNINEDREEEENS